MRGFVALLFCVAVAGCSSKSDVSEVNDIEENLDLAQEALGMLSGQWVRETEDCAVRAVFPEPNGTDSVDFEYHISGCDMGLYQGVQITDFRLVSFNEKIGRSVVAFRQIKPNGFVDGEFGKLRGFTVSRDDGVDYLNIMLGSYTWNDSDFTQSATVLPLKRVDE